MSRKQAYTDEQLGKILEVWKICMVTIVWHIQTFFPSEFDISSLEVTGSPDNQVNMNDDDNIHDKAPLQPIYSRLATEVPLQTSSTLASDISALSNSGSSDSASSDAINTSVQAPRISVPRPTTDDMKQYDENEGWNYDIQPLHREDFTSESFLHIDHIPENADVFTIFRLLVDDEVLDFMVQQTNLYAKQTIAANPGGRLTRWKPVTREDIEKFMGIYLVTGIIRFPSLESHWKRDPIYNHPLMHIDG